MADDQPLDDQPLDGPVGTVLDLTFDSGTLGTLRAGVRSHAGQAGLSEDRAEDVVLAVHELAANAVCHGNGTGRLHLWKRDGALYCQVEDGDPPAAGDPAEPRPGHGLWVVNQVCDLMEIRTSQAAGTIIRLHMRREGR